MMRRILLGGAALMLALTIPSSPADAWKCHRHPEKPDCTTTTTTEDEHDAEQEGREAPRCPCDTTTTTEPEVRGGPVPDDPTTTTTVVHDVAPSTTTTTAVAEIIPPLVTHRDPPPPAADNLATDLQNREPQQLDKLPVTGPGTAGLTGGVLLTLGGAAVALGKRRSPR